MNVMIILLILLKAIIILLAITLGRKFKNTTSDDDYEPEITDKDDVHELDVDIDDKKEYDS